MEAIRSLKALFFPGLAVLGLTLGTAQAECRYFRVSYKLLHCRQEKAVPTQADQSSMPLVDEPFLGETDDSPLARVMCSCDYGLSGSNPQCDFDHTEEHSALIPAPDPTETCSKGKTLCETICPKNLP